MGTVILLIGVVVLFLLAIFIVIPLLTAMFISYGVKFPGEEAKKVFSEAVPIEFKKNISKENNYSITDAYIVILTEGSYSEPIGNVRWRLHLFFTIFNNSNYQIDVYDMHVNKYLSVTSLLNLPLAAPVDIRERIELYHTNSILAGGRIYPIKPGERMPVELILEITRTKQWSYEREASPADGFMLSIFGVFVDYHITKESKTSSIRIPSDSIFSFQSSEQGHLVYVNSNNLDVFREHHKKNPGGRGLVKAFQKALKKHTAQSFELN